MVLKGDSDSKHRVSRFGTRLGLGIGLELQALMVSGIGLGLVKVQLLVSDSESGLEIWNSENSDVNDVIPW